MVLDALRGYVQIATGLTEVTRKRAAAAAKALVNQGNLDEVVPESVREQVSAVADEVVAQARANGDLVRTIVRGEVERVVAQLGLVPSDELDRAARRAERLAERVQELEEQIAASSPVRAAATPTPAAPKAPARKAPARKPPTTSTPTPAAPENTTAATAAPESTARKATPRKAAATKKATATGRTTSPSRPAPRQEGQE